MHSNGLNFSGTLEESSQFFVFKNAKINFLMELSVLSAVFIELRVQVVTDLSSGHEKHQTLDFLLMTDFLIFF